MFIGEYHHAIDEKGRLAVPVKFRSEMAKGGVVTRGLDNCLFIYTKQSWQELADRLSKLPLAQANSRAFARLMLAGAMEVSVDGQGRVMVPEYLRKFASIKKTVVVAGLYNRIEVWDEKEWEKYRKGTETKSGDIAETLSELGV
jgi:MraZ protein